MALKRILIFAALLFSSLKLFSQDTAEPKPLFWLGAYADYSRNLHSVDFKKLPGVATCCPQYTSGSGNGYSFGGLFEMSIVPSLNFGLRLGFADMSALLKEQETAAKVLVRDGSGVESVQDLNIEHIIDSKLYMIGLEPIVSFKFFDNFISHFGFRLAYLLTAKFDKKETIISPQNIVFLDGRTVRNDTAGMDIPDKNSFQFFGVFGLGYELPIGKESYLIPEMRYAMPFTNISSVDWKPASLQFGLSVRFPIYPAKKLPIIQDTVYQRDTTMIAILGQKAEAVRLISSSDDHTELKEKDVIIQRTIVKEHYERKVPKSAPISSSMDITGISQDGVRSPNPTMVIEETEVTEGFPLLPQVFFKPGSSKLEETSLHLLPDKSATQNFREDKLKWNTLEIYNDLLNIIGSRLLDNPSAKLTITGCNNNSGSEAGNLNLSGARAEAVKNYLTKIWNVNPDQIRIKKQNLPDIPGNIQDKDGIEENQRAELLSENYEIMKPVNLKDVQLKANPPIVEIAPYVITDLGVKSWDVVVDQDAKQIRKFAGTNQPKQLIWKVEEEPLPKLETPIKVQFTAFDEIDQKTVATKEITIEQKTIRKKRVVFNNDTIIEKFSLIVFDFNKADLTPQQKTVLESVKQRIKPNSKVIISGYTDRTGEKEYNRELAHRRTLEVQKYLKVSDAKLTLNPVGNDILLFDNDIPQGRSYCRTVQIVIETPVKE